MESKSSEKRPLINEKVNSNEDIRENPEVTYLYWGWVVVLVSFFNIAMIDGVGYTTGILLDSLLEELGGGRGGVAVVGSLQVGVYSLSGPLVGKLIGRFGARPVCIAGALISCFGLFGASFATNLVFVLISYSVIAGFGFGMMYIPSVVGVAPYFTVRRALAIGICLCGSGVGTFALAPISQYILDHFGWRWVFRTFSAICLFCVLCGSAMAPIDNEEEELQKEDMGHSTIDKENFSNNICSIFLGEDLASSKSLVVFFLVVLADFLAFTAIYIPYTHLPPLAKFAGVSSGDAAFIISAGGISNTIGRLVGGWLSDQPWSHPLYLTLMAVVAAIIPSFVLPSCIAYWTFIMSFGFFGFVTGCQVGCTSPMLVRLLGLSCLTQAFGIMTALRGIAALVGPPSAGLLVDDFLEPGLALYLCGALMVASSCIATVASVINRLSERSRANYIEI